MNEPTNEKQTPPKHSLHCARVPVVRATTDLFGSIHTAATAVAVAHLPPHRPGKPLGSFTKGENGGHLKKKSLAAYTVGGWRRCGGRCWRGLRRRRLQGLPQHQHPVKQGTEPRHGTWKGGTARSLRAANLAFLRFSTIIFCTRIALHTTPPTLGLLHSIANKCRRSVGWRGTHE